MGRKVIPFTGLQSAAQAAAMVLAGAEAPHALVALDVARELGVQLRGGIPLHEPEEMRRMAGRCRTLAVLVDQLRVEMETEAQA